MYARCTPPVDGDNYMGQHKEKEKVLEYHDVPQNEKRPSNHDTRHVVGESARSQRQTSDKDTEALLSAERRFRQVPANNLDRGDMATGRDDYYKSVSDNQRPIKWDLRREYPSERPNR